MAVDVICSYYIENYTNKKQKNLEKQTNTE